MSESNPYVGGARYGVSASRACKAGTGGASESTPYLGGIRKRVFVTMPYIGEKKYSFSNHAYRVGKDTCRRYTLYVPARESFSKRLQTDNSNAKSQYFGL